MTTKIPRLIKLALSFLIAAWPVLMAAQVEPADSPVMRPVISEEIAPTILMEPISPDGYRGQGFLRKPPGDGPFPAVVLIRGGLVEMLTEVVRRNTLRATASRFLEAGYVVAYIEYRDRSLAPESPLPPSDALAAVEYVKALDYVDANSVVLNGCSGGGDYALQIAGQTEVAATVSEEPATIGIMGIFNSSVPKAGERYVMSDAFPLLQNLGAYYTDEAERLIREHVERIRGPVFIIQGDQLFRGVDLLIPQNEVLIPMLEASGVDFKREVYAGQAHCFALEGETQAALTAFQDIDTFFREHLPTQPVPIDGEYVTHARMDAPPQWSVPVTVEILEDYVGSYAVGDGYPVDITLDDGQLVAVVGQSRTRIPLFGESETIFTSVAARPRPFAIEFFRGDDGTVTHFMSYGDRAQKQ